MSGHCDVSFGGDDYDGEQSPFYDVQHPKARKPHHCYECRCGIAVGEQYSRVTGKWDGQIVTTKFCCACYDINQEFGDGGVYGELWEHFRSEWESGARIQSCIARVETVAAKTKLRDMWLKWKQLQ